MAYNLDTVDVWAATIKDQPGGLMKVLDDLAGAGINLEFVIARRDKRGSGVVFCAPIPDAKARVARKAGLRKSRSLRSLRISGPDKAGIGAAISGAVGSSGVNLRGFSGAAIGRRAVFYIAFDSQGDADRARRAIRRRLR